MVIAVTRRLVEMRWSAFSSSCGIFHGIPTNQLGLGEIVASESRLIESHAPGRISRRSVYKPLQTGLIAIDSMIPIGRGQREFIIGDRQTGKTAVATDTIRKTKGKKNESERKCK